MTVKKTILDSLKSRKFRFGGYATLIAVAALAVVIGINLVVDQIPADNPQVAVLKDYAAKYQAEFGKDADTFGGHAWDAIKLVANAIERGAEDRAGIRDRIEQTQGFVGTGGVFNFTAQDHNGLTKEAFVLVTVKSGKWELVK